MAPSPSPRCEDIDVTNQVNAFLAIDARRKAQGIRIRDFERITGVPNSTFYVWKRGARTARVSGLVSLASAVGLGVRINGENEGFTFGSTVDAVAFLHQRRNALGLNPWEVEARSGVGVTSYYCWMKGEREPGLFSFAALAQALQCSFTLALKGYDRNGIIEAKILR